MTDVFIIDSIKLNDVTSKMYGFALSNEGIFDEDNIHFLFNNLNGTGVYVAVIVEKSIIRVKQDYLGSFGIYIWEKDNRFCISNSFFGLLDYLKENNCILSLNVDYYLHLFASLGSSNSVTLTPVNEIRLLPRDVEIIIDKMNETYKLCREDYSENTIALNSKEGLECVDEWFEKYTSIIYALGQAKANITVDVTGGFDSRIILLLVLCSGIPLDRVIFNTYTDNNPVHVEDYEIAQLMAEKYGFELNKARDFPGKIISSDYILEYEYYMRWGVTKEFSRYDYTKKYDAKLINFCGAGGETLRGYDKKLLSEMKNDYEIVINDRYSWGLGAEIKESSNKILDDSFSFVENRQSGTEDLLVSAMYTETRARSHYGKYSVRYLLNNHYMVSPHLDPLLHKIKLVESKFGDPYLLFAVIMDRFLPSIIEFPFEGERSINPETLKLARELNRIHPRTRTKVPSKKPFSVKLECNNSNKMDLIPEKANYNIRNLLIELFESRKCKGIFCEYFDEEIYEQAVHHYQSNSYSPCFQMDAILSAVLTIIKCDSKSRPGIINTIIDSRKDYYGSQKANIIDRIEYIPFVTARVDVFMKDASYREFILRDISDKEAFVNTPRWLNNGRRGYMISSTKKQFKINCQCSRNGIVTINLLALDERTQKCDSTYFIDYYSVEVNGEEKMIKPVRANRINPHCVTLNVDADDVLNIVIKWAPQATVVC